MTHKISHDSETPAQGQQVHSATAFIHHQSPEGRKLFLAQRAATKKFLPKIWELPGGHVDFGEDIVEALAREVHEEFNTRVQIGEPFAAFTYMNPVKGSHSIEVIYFAQFLDPIENVQIYPEDHSQYHWFLPTELSEIFSHKPSNDPEVAAIKRGFELLSGESLNFG